MAIVVLGNSAPTEGVRSKLPDDLSRDDLIAAAALAGVSILERPEDETSPELDDAMLRARIEAVVVKTPMGGVGITRVDVPGGQSLMDAANSVTHRNGLWNSHSDAPPAWVESDWPELQALLAAHFECPIGRPDGWMT